MPLNLVIDKASTKDCATGMLRLPEIPDFPLVINLVNLTLGGKASSHCLVSVEINGETIEHTVHQRRHVEDCRHILSRLPFAPSSLFLERVLSPVVEELQAQLGIPIALPIAVRDPLTHLKALANAASAGLISLKQLENNLGL
jgi:hypothetical protein